jgi:acyl-coenzyme A synthetase/AMP-(fatty) acid ligase
MPDVEVPEPPHLVASLLDRLAGRSHAPLAVLEPTWPKGLREQAMADLADAVGSGRLADDDLVLFTSGSSGSPRAVVRTVSSWRSSLEPLTDVIGVRKDGGHELVWVPGPLTSSLFLYGALHAGWTGLPWVGGRADAPGVQGATAAHLVPTQLADALDAREQGLLPQLRTAVVAGAQLAPSLRERAAQHGWRLVEYYGAAELSFVGWRDHGGAFESFPGAETQVVDGVLWVRSPYVARGYLRAVEGPWLHRDGWHTVGDRARPVAGGWTLLGRGDASITTGGHTVVVQEVESLLGEVPGVRDVVVLGLPHDRLGETVAAVVRPTRTADASLRQQLETVARRLPEPARPRHWLRADEMPVLASGKVDRAALRRAVSSRELPPL